MMERKPEVRFREFDDDWEQRKLGEIAEEILAGGDIDKTKENVIQNTYTEEQIISLENTRLRLFRAENVF